MFAEHYGSIITRPLSKKWITKERGYVHFSRFSEQRLFNIVVPVLERFKETAFAVQMIMQSFSLVPISSVENKLQELLPFLTNMDFHNESTSAQTKLNCLYLFRKVLTADAEEGQDQ